MHTFKYKADPYKATDNPNAHREPALELMLESIDEQRKRIFVRTRQKGIRLILCYNRKYGVFQLHKFTPLGNVGAHVYNNWTLMDDIQKATRHWE